MSHTLVMYMNNDEEFEAPLAFVDQTVIADWIDFNGHMNVAYYLYAFDRCVDVMYNRLGVGPEQIQESGCSVFTLEAHISYLQEVVEGDPLRITGRLVNFDHKRIHAYFEMYHAIDNYIVAAMEQIGIHVDMKERKSVAFADANAQLLARMMISHKTLPEPRYAGRVMSIPEKKSSQK